MEKFNYETYNRVCSAFTDLSLKMYGCCGGKDTSEILELMNAVTDVKLKFIDLYNRDPERRAEVERDASENIRKRIEEGLANGTVYKGEDGIYRYCNTLTSNGYICDENGIWRVSFRS